MIVPPSQLSNLEGFREPCSNEIPVGFFYQALSQRIDFSQLRTDLEIPALDLGPPPPVLLKTAARAAAEYYGSTRPVPHGATKKSIFPPPLK